MKVNRFRQAQRLRRPSEFRRVYERRRSASDSALVLYACENGLEYSRFGVSVGRKLGGAVQRNRLKRLLREAFRLCRADLPRGLDLVAIPRGTEAASLDRFIESLAALAGQVQRKLGTGPK